MRPHVSDDNPFSEAQFKTMKYRPDFPRMFGSIEHGRAHCIDFFAWYNDEHHHSGLAMFTPADVHFSRVDDRHAVRQAVIDAAFEAHPERFPHGPPAVRRPPTVVWINPPVDASGACPPARAGGALGRAAADGEQARP